MKEFQLDIINKSTEFRLDAWGQKGVDHQTIIFDDINRALSAGRRIVDNADGAIHLLLCGLVDGEWTAIEFNVFGEGEGTDV